MLIVMYGMRLFGDRGSCVYDFIKSMAANNVKSITTFSDKWAGQNRNRYFLTMFCDCLKTLHLENVCHKYLEHGHSQNENHSVHSAIESSCKHCCKSCTQHLSGLLACK